MFNNLFSKLFSGRTAAEKVVEVPAPAAAVAATEEKIPYINSEAVLLPSTRRAWWEECKGLVEESDVSRQRQSQLLGKKLRTIEEEIERKKLLEREKEIHTSCFKILERLQNEEREKVAGVQRVLDGGWQKMMTCFNRPTTYFRRIVVRDEGGELVLLIGREDLYEPHQPNPAWIGKFEKSSTNWEDFTLPELTALQAIGK